MFKLKVSGSFMLVDPETRVEFSPGETITVKETTRFIEERVASGDLISCNDAFIPEPPPEPEVSPGDPIEVIPVVDYTPVFPPLDHDGDGKAGGSLKGDESTAHKGASRKKGRK